jgi:hypothetical protein
MAVFLITVIKESRLIYDLLASNVKKHFGTIFYDKSLRLLVRKEK